MKKFTLDSMDIDTLKDFIRFLKKKPTPAPDDAWEWCDEQMASDVEDAIGIVAGMDYLPFLKQKVQMRLPVNRIVQTKLYPYKEAVYAADHQDDKGTKFPHYLYIPQLLKMAKAALKKADCGQQFVAHK